MLFLTSISLFSGYVCAPTTSERLEQLEIPMMVPKNTDPLRTAYGVSIDFKYGTTTGISAADRAKTANALADPSIINGDDFNKPGHLLPLKARPNGVLERQGHTEAAVGK
jgi:3,4-dihydroxy-2-butanone 4-phosphate synthase